MNARWLVPFAATALAACSVPAVPDFTYYRLPRAHALEPAPAPLFRDALVVEPFNADGLYADQALIYALDSGAQQLRQYHYQLWTDPPTRILQRRLILELRDAHATAEVTDELPASTPAVHVSGIILRFDRVPSTAGAFDAVVALRLRASAHDGSVLVDEYYRAQKPAGGAAISATVDAYGAAVDEIFAQFYADLRKRAENARAR
ncbi:MAG TPA: ABC-type transport auxiliary lipoprotein family protein [Dokdonella sp.]